EEKAKVHGFIPGWVLPKWLSPRPSLYALGKIRNVEYIELDYFTTKGCKEATNL
ncbi:hypothetical protein EI94DRAFT_1463519, partial [Lactarius quietus]